MDSYSQGHRFWPIGPNKLNKKISDEENVWMIKLLCVTWNTEYVEFRQSDLNPDENGEYTIPNTRTYDGQSSHVRGSRMKSVNGTERQPPSAMFDLLPLNYDIYVLCFQEVKKPKELLRAACRHLNENLDRQGFACGGYYLVDSNRVIGLSGHGDGAYLSKKMTTISVIVHKHLLVKKRLRIGPEISASIPDVDGGKGSKGAVGQILYIDGEALLVLSCHMPSKSPAARFAARDKIREKLILSLQSNGFNLSSPHPLNKLNEDEAHLLEDQEKLKLHKVPKLIDIVHNVIWAGDFNLRWYPYDEDISINLQTYLNNLWDDRGLQKYIKYDEIQAFKHVDEVDQVEFNNFPFSQYVRDWFEHFNEEPITFPPTYKKVPQRICYKEGTGDLTQEYVFNFKGRWYKGFGRKGIRNRKKLAFPSWCDRILYSSRCNTLSPLRDTYKSVRPMRSYSPWLQSDHDPVMCGFQIRANPTEFYPIDHFTDARKVQFSTLVPELKISPMYERQNKSKTIRFAPMVHETATDETPEIILPQRKTHQKATRRSDSRSVGFRASLMRTASTNKRYRVSTLDDTMSASTNLKSQRKENRRSSRMKFN